ncbi:MAG: pilus assembly protein [Chloroflexota bacterium]|nr:pilus assembly protein [Chloroflexota bacterium]
MKMTPPNEPRGQSMVEFALIVPIFVLVVVGLFDAGRAIYAFNTIQNASREAVRLAIVNQNDSAIEAEAIAAAVGLGIQASDVIVTVREGDFATGGTGTCSASPDIGCVIEVAVNYTYTAATPVVGTLMGSIPMTGQSRQPIEFAFESP